MPTSTSKFDFAAAMAELESITTYLESDDVELEVAMQKFERGAELAQELKLYLNNAENTITTIKQKFDSPKS